MATVAGSTSGNVGDDDRDDRDESGEYAAATATSASARPIVLACACIWERARIGAALARLRDHKG